MAPPPEVPGDEIELIATPGIVNFVDLYCQYRSQIGEIVDRNDFIKDQGSSGPKTITFRQLLMISKERKHLGAISATPEEKTKGKRNEMYLHEIIAGSNIYRSPLKEPERSPELVKRLEKLKKELEEREYNQMVENVSGLSKNSSFGKEIGQAVRTTSQEVSSIVNFVLSVVGCFVFAYYASQYAFGNVGLQLIFSIVFAAIVALAELYFMARTEI